MQSQDLTSNSCFLDGRYLDLVLNHLPGWIPEPLYIMVDEKGIPQMNMVESIFHGNMSDLIYRRVILFSSKFRHSCALVVSRAQGINEAWFWNPKSGQRDNLDLELNLLLSNYLSKRGGYKLNTLNLTIPPIASSHNKNCTKEGYCNAFVLKFILDLVNNKYFDMWDIRRFMYEIESSYTLPENTEPDIEYDTEFSGTGALIGGGAGALIGAIGGPAGLLLGAGAGALIGGVAGGAIESNRNYMYPQSYSYPQQTYMYPQQSYMYPQQSCQTGMCQSQMVRPTHILYPVQQEEPQITHVIHHHDAMM